MAGDNIKADQEKGKKQRKRSSQHASRELASLGMALGRVPPQATDLEEAVLGAIMLDKNGLPTVLNILKPESFYLEKHQVIYQAMIKLFDQSQSIDLLTVHEALLKAGDMAKVGGPSDLAALTTRVTSAANIEFHARIIEQKAIQRALIHVSNEVIKQSFEDTTDVFDLLDFAEQELFAIAQQNLSGNVESVSALASQYMKELEELSSKEEGLTGIPTGFVDLDRLTNGWQFSDLIIIAARPSMGKTAFVLSLARNAALEFKKGVAIFSLEMSNIQLMQRLFSMEAGIPNDKLRSGKLEDDQWERLNDAIERFSEAPIFIDDTAAIDIFSLRAKCRRLKMQHDIQLVVIDYLQLMTGGTGNNNNREQVVSTISRSLKAMAKDLNIPVIALSQLSRAVEVRGGDKRPMLSDLRESGSIEQDADIVSFIYRPEYYKITEDEEGNSLKNVTEVIVAKHRNGETRTIKLKFVPEFIRFEDLPDPGFDNFPAFNDPNQGVITKPSGFNDDEEVPF